MSIRKSEFYEGAAIHQLVRGGQVHRISHEPPFFAVNERHLIYLKYSTKGRTPWGFTFAPEEQALLKRGARRHSVVIGLICGPDGIAAMPYDCYRKIAEQRKSSIHISCARKHGHHYAVAGPDGKLDGKIPPSLWHRILDGENNAAL